MAGYLTKVMILIKTEQWLRDLESALVRKQAALRGENRCLSQTEQGVLGLARKSLSYLRLPASPTAAQITALAPARIENGVGDGVSKYAYAGAIGPDFPGAANVFALRNRWVADTMHKGAPRRAWVDAGSTKFVLNFLEKTRAARDLDEDERRAMMSYALGHLSSVATDVILNPFINHAAWDTSSPRRRGRKEIAVEIDARVAQGFFQRGDMKEGQSWEDYFPERGDYARQIEKLSEVYLEAFKATYGGDQPNEALCGVPAAECAAARLDKDFLVDGYRNATNWAIDTGYDQHPTWFRLLWAGAVTVGAVFTVQQFWSVTGAFSTVTSDWFGWNSAEVATVRGINLAKWNDGGFFANERAWYDALDVSYSWAGYVFVPFSLLATGFLGWDGIFGQGTTGFFRRPGSVVAYKIIKNLYSFGAKPAIGFFATEFWHRPYIRWPRFFVDFFIDVGEALLVSEPSVERGREGYELDFRIWEVKLSLFSAYFISLIFVFGIKSARNNSGGGRETGYSVWDFLLGAILPACYIGGVIWGGYFEQTLIKGTTDSDWPGTDTAEVDRFLPVETAGGRRTFRDAGAAEVPVALFPEATLAEAGGGRKYYPEDIDITSPTRGMEYADEAQRKDFSDDSPQSYKLNRLFDTAAQFSAMLAMAAVNYEQSSPLVRDQVKAIFQDWNLDYLAARQWGELMGDTGLLNAVGDWWDDLSHDRFNTGDTVLERIGSDIPMRSLSGTLHADFDHDRTTAVGDGPGRCHRLNPPGAILLANLDIDEPPPDPLPSPLPSRLGLRDAVRDAVVNGGNDLTELSPLEVHPPAIPATPASEMVLRLHARDAARVRVFRGTGADPSALTWTRCLGGAAADTEFALPGSTTDVTQFRVEALTLAGDPALPAPTGAGPFTPAPVTPRGTPGEPVVASRAPGEVWVELLLKESGAEVQGARDLALFTIAPYMLLAPQQPTVRVYVAYFSGTSGNHPMVADLVEALEEALPGRVRSRVHTRPPTSGDPGEAFIPHKPVAAGHLDATGRRDDADGLYIINGDEYHDQWVQDEFELGYCFAPHASMHVALHCPRGGDTSQLGAFVVSELPGADVGLFNSLSRTGLDSVNYGGNIEVSPPVAGATTSLTHGDAGPEVVAHPPAPFGKIIIGEGGRYLFDLAASFQAELDRDSTASAALRGALLAELDTRLPTAIGVSPVEIGVRVPGKEWVLALEWEADWPDPHSLSGFTRGTVPFRFLLYKEGAALKVHEGRVLEPAYRKFLDAQKAQPVVSIDTSWLAVGHVDEIISIVHADDARGFKLLMASPQLARRILSEAKARRDSAGVPLTDLFRGRSWRAGRAPRAATSLNARISVDDLLDDTDVRLTNEHIQDWKLTPIKQRLRHVLGIGEADVLRLPTVFDKLPAGTTFNGGARTVAFTPGLVNLLEVERHVMVPRPFGPRMAAADVLTVLSKPGINLTGADPALLTPLVGHWHWDRKNSLALNIASTYGLTEADIVSEARNAGKFDSIGFLINEWDKVWIPENNVDLFEAYTVIVLSRIGLTVHFIDDWDTYHRMDGEVHCGTNVIRTPPEAASGYAGPFWWQSYS